MSATDYDFALTRNEILKESFEALGVLQEGESLTSEQIIKGVKGLGIVLSSWESKGIHFWQIVQQSLSVINGTASYDLATEWSGDPAILGIMNSTYQSGTDDIYVEVIPRRKYFSIFEKGSTGNPLYVYYDQAEKKIYVYPTPDNSYTIDMYVVRRIKDSDSASTAPDVDRTFQKALILALALHLAPSYAIPLGERNWIKAEFKDAMKDAMEGDHEYTGVQQTEGYW